MREGRSRRAAVWAVVIPLLMFVALGAWALSSPPGSSPDEDFHLTSIWCGQGTRDGLCEAGRSDGTRRVPESVEGASACYAFKPDTSAACTDPLAAALTVAVRGNFDGSYPPVFYAVMSVFASSDTGASVIAMRIGDAGLFVGLMTATFFLLHPSRRPAALWGTAVTVVPLGVDLIASVNPSSWAIISAPVLWASLTGFFDEPRPVRRVALAGIAVLAAVMGAGARSDAAGYCVVIAAAVCVAEARPTRRFAWSLLLPAGITLIAAAFFLGSGQSSVLVPGSDRSISTQMDDRFEGPLTVLVARNVVNLPGLFAGAFGSTPLGWNDVNMPPLVWIPALITAAAVSACGLRTAGRRRLVSAALVAAAAVAIPMYILLRDRLEVGSGVQPRYLLPLLIVLACVCVGGASSPSLALSRVQLGLVVAALSIAFAVALHSQLRRYVTGSDVDGANLDSGLEWWWGLPFGPMPVWAIGTIAFATAIGGLAWTASRIAAEQRASDPVPA